MAEGKGIGAPRGGEDRISIKRKGDNSMATRNKREKHNEEKGVIATMTARGEKLAE